MFAIKFSMEKRISFFWTAGFFLPAINATVFSKKFIHKKILPSGQMHSKEPISFLHSPPKHNPGMASHSLISMHFPVWTFFKNPGWQDNFSGQLSQGCPQAFPIVAQQSCLVQTTPSNCPVHISFSMRLLGAIHKWRYHSPERFTNLPLGLMSSILNWIGLMYSYWSPGVSQSPKYSSLQNMWKETRCIFAPNLAFLPWRPLESNMEVCEPFC